MTRYFAHISHEGKIRYGEVPGSIGVLEALDKFMPIGEASCRTHDENGLAVWTLRFGSNRAFTSRSEEQSKWPLPLK